MGSPDAACPLPQHLVEEILLKLPVQSLLRFKAVSKHLNSLISSADFITSHHQYNTKTNPSSIFLGSRSIFRCDNLAISDAPLLEKLNPPFMGQPIWHCLIVGYANGLFCFKFRYVEGIRFILWNPATKQFKRIRFLWNGYIGFGYHSGIQDYKFFGIAGSNCLHVLSLRRGTRREIQISDLRLVYSWNNENCSTVVVNEVWYRAIIDPIRGMLGIFSFDLKEDLLAWIDSPIPLGPTNYRVQIGLYYDKVCLFASDHLRNGRCHLDMWVLEGKASWRKISTIDLAATGTPAIDYRLCPVRGVMHGSRLLFNAYPINGSKHSPTCFLYDLSTNGWKEIPTANSGIYCLAKVHDYVESLVSPEVARGLNENERISWVAGVPPRVQPARNASNSVLHMGEMKAEEETKTKDAGKVICSGPKLNEKEKISWVAGVPQEETKTKDAEEAICSRPKSKKKLSCILGLVSMAKMCWELRTGAASVPRPRPGTS